jgi:hypothetical protein
VRWKRPLYLIHRWAGIVLCLFFALWFVSGLFMMYVEFPQLTAPEWRAGAQSLDFSSAKLTPAEAAFSLHAVYFNTSATPSQMRTLPIADADAPVTALSRVQLGMLLDRPAYRFQVSGAQPRSVYADDGELLKEVTPAFALRSATDFALRAGWIDSAQVALAHYEETIQTDQWTVSAALNAHRPLLRIALGDSDDTMLYVSSTTGEVVRDSHRMERMLNYAGAVTHWLYPTFIRRYPDAWAWMIDILASAGTILGITGLWIGIMRWRIKRREGQSAIPYRGLMRWHHITGLAFGLTAVTWVLSGWLSMNPGSINPSRSAATAESLVYSGKALTASDFNAPVAALFDRALVDHDSVEAELMHYDGQPLYKITQRDGLIYLAGATSTTPRLPDERRLLDRAAMLKTTAQLESAEVMTRYDNYYYTRHPEDGGKPLPVIRVRFADDQHTWFHIDPLTGQVLDRSTRWNRVYRWLYNGLHSWDIQWLWEHRPLWDIAVISFSLGGLMLSIVGVIAGWRRLRWEMGMAPLPTHTRTSEQRAT